MTKKFRIAGIVAAVMLALGGITMIVYAATTLNKTINHTITFKPDYAVLDVSASGYYIYPGSSGSLGEKQPVDFVDNVFSPPEVNFTDKTGYIVYELVFTTQYSNIEYIISTAGSDTDVIISYNDTDLGSGYSLITNSVKNDFSTGGGTIFIKVAFDSIVTAGAEKNVEILIYCDPKPE